MHEMSIVEALLEQVGREVERSGEAGRVTRIDLAVGRLSGVNPDSLRFAFDMLAPGTPLAEAQLTITEPKAACACDSCGLVSEIDDPGAACPGCGSPEIVIRGGRDLILESIELEIDPSRGGG